MSRRYFIYIYKYYNSVNAAVGLSETYTSVKLCV